MNKPKFEWILTFFKALADENRLKIVNLLNEREYNVGELAEIMGLSESTISHHLSKLRPTGMLNLRTHGNQHFYVLNKNMLKRFGQQIASLEAIDFGVDKSQPDKAWIDKLDLSDPDKKVLWDYTENGCLRQIPMKQSKLLAIVRWLVLQFEPNRFYTEQEVNEIIKPIHEDYAGLRRDMIGFGFLRREPAGTKYWLTPEDEQITFEHGEQ
jgi:hypothetical protein